jgi:ribosomal protein L16/L10AE
LACHDFHCFSLFSLLKLKWEKGNGNSTSWIACVVEGQILFEMDGVSLLNVQKVATEAAHKLCLSTKFVQWF